MLRILFLLRLEALLVLQLAELVFCFLPLEPASRPAAFQ
jgi:hypothetical protein